MRRAERSAWAALAVHGDTMNPLTAHYLNRLSDLLFILARRANLPRRRRALEARRRPPALVITAGRGRPRQPTQRS